MSWAKLDDQFPDHPKIEAAGPEAAWLYVCGICYCARYLTDGEIPKTRVPRLSALKSAEKHAKKLVAVGLWIDAGTSYLVHDYLDYNPPRDEVEFRREQVSRKRSEAGRRGAAARWGDGKNGKRDGKPDGSLPHPLPETVDGKPMAPSPSPSPYEDEREIYDRDGCTRDEPDDFGAAVIDLAAKLSEEAS